MDAAEAEQRVAEVRSRERAPDVGSDPTGQLGTQRSDLGGGGEGAEACGEPDEIVDVGTQLLGMAGPSSHVGLASVPLGQPEDLPDLEAVLMARSKTAAGEHREATTGSERLGGGHTEEPSALLDAKGFK